MPYTDILLVGSSLCNQVSRGIQESGLNIDNLFKGNISLENIKNKLIKNNRSYKKIFFISGNNLYPSKLHKTQRGSHVCLKPFALELALELPKKLRTPIIAYFSMLNAKIDSAL